MDFESLLASYQTELKRGVLTLTVLGFLKTPQYGYSLLERLESKDVPIESGTLYPLLRRLEKQGILTSEWNTDETRPRKYYKLSDMGLKMYERLAEEWLASSRQLEQILKENEHDVNQ